MLQSIPEGLVILYLELIDPHQPELGWKLLEEFNSENQKLVKGYSLEAD